MAPTDYPQTIYHGQSFDRVYSVTADQTPFDFTGHTVTAAVIHPESPGVPSPPIVCTTNSAAGTIAIHIDRNELAKLTPRTGYLFDLILTEGNKHTVLLRSENWEVKRGATQPRIYA